MKNQGIIYVNTRSHSSDVFLKRATLFKRARDSSRIDPSRVISLPLDMHRARSFILVDKIVDETSKNLGFCIVKTFLPTFLVNQRLRNSYKNSFLYTALRIRRLSNRFSSRTKRFNHKTELQFLCFVRKFRNIYIYI